MERTRIADLSEKISERVRIRGWAQAVRDQKRVQFVVVRDESGLAQVVLGKDEQPSELNELLSGLTVESAVTVTGTVVADERVKLGGLSCSWRASRSTLLPSLRCRSRLTPPWTSGSTGAIWTCAGRTGS
jgi:hypothetical protein